MSGSRRRHKEGVEGRKRALPRAGTCPPSPVRQNAEAHRDRDGAAFASLTIRQPQSGYRFSIDSVLLADFASAFCGEVVLDLGTGCGVALLLLSRMCGSLRYGVGVEVQRELYEFARGNIEENGFSGSLSAVHGDFREKLPGLSGGSFDLVISNPPYRRVGDGRRNPDPQKEIARHEVMCTMPELFRSAGRYLSPTGRFAMLGLPQRLGEMLSCATAERIFPDTLRFVHPYPDKPANLLLFAASRRKPPEFSVLPPLAVYSEKGRYHPDVERIYQAVNPASPD
ncbi:MAG: methyltransferase [Deltaproteobacteria bacterium]|nr:methyltransferase [Deltaproteobacteria bacterium]